MARRLLIEQEITEVEILKEGDKGQMQVKALLQVSDKKNKNNRFYPRAVLEREVGRYQQRIQQRQAFAAGDHPDDGRTKIPDVVSLWDRIWIDKDGVVWGEGAIIPTHKGQDLQAILRAGGSVSNSARGWGDTTPTEMNGETVEVVNENYELRAYDFVIGGGFEEAGVKRVTEEEDPDAGQGGPTGKRTITQEESAMDIKTLSDLRVAHPALVQELEASIKSGVEESLVKSFEQKVLAKISEERAQITEAVKEQLAEEWGVEGMQNTLTAIAEAILPYIELKEHADPGAVQKELDTVTEELGRMKCGITDQVAAATKLLTEQVEAERKAREEAQSKTDSLEAQTYLVEAVKTRMHSAELADELKDCRTKKEIDERIGPAEEKLKKLFEKAGQPAGKGHVQATNEDKPAGGELTEEQKRQRHLAGIRL